MSITKASTPPLGTTPLALRSTTMEEPKMVAEAKESSLPPLGDSKPIFRHNMKLDYSEVYERVKEAKEAKEAKPEKKKKFVDQERDCLDDALELMRHAQEPENSLSDEAMSAAAALVQNNDDEQSVRPLVVEIIFVFCRSSRLTGS